MKHEHIYTFVVLDKYYDRKMECNVEVREQRCIFCGKKETEKAYLRDPPRNGVDLPKFINDDLSTMF